MNKDRLIQISRNLKLEYQTGRSFHTSFIFHGPKLLTMGINSYKEHHLITRIPVYRQLKTTGFYQAGIHSEVAAAKNLDFKCEGLTLVNIRIDNNGNPAYSAPCGNCWEYIVEKYGFRKVWFTTNDGWKLLKVR